MDGNSLQSMSPSQKDELMRTVQAQVALANMQEMLSVRKAHASERCASEKDLSAIIVKRYNTLHDKWIPVLLISTNSSCHLLLKYTRYLL